jgi:proteasome lid subunit RPN8/RPN11
VRESGAFLLGEEYRGRRNVKRFIFYDDLDPDCLGGGFIQFSSSGYGVLWRLCRETGQKVVGDIHTHPHVPRQSQLDRDHPMIGLSGHIAIIVPDFALRQPAAEELGVYEYLGDHRWRDFSGGAAGRFLYIGFWG